MGLYHYKLWRPTPYGNGEEKVVCCTRDQLDSYLTNGWRCINYW